MIRSSYHFKGGSTVDGNCHCRLFILKYEILQIIAQFGQGSFVFFTVNASTIAYEKFTSAVN
jgi:hypothetical protein